MGFTIYTFMECVGSVLFVVRGQVTGVGKAVYKSVG